MLPRPGLHMLCDSAGSSAGTPGWPNTANMEQHRIVHLCMDCGDSHGFFCRIENACTSWRLLSGQPLLMERSEQLQIPAGFPVGSLFGREGRHLRDVKARTGARIEIKEQGRAAYITISGQAAAVQAAARFYRSRFQEHEAAGGQPEPCMLKVTA